MQKILIAVLIVAVVALAGVVVWQNWPRPSPVVNNQPVANCLKAGEINATGYNSSEESLDCCSGLKFIPVVDAWRNPDGSVDTTCNEGRLGVPYNVVCTFCGNGVCGKGENKCNCPQDCK